MHFIDILIIICLGYGIIQGLWKGFFYEMAGFIALGLGIFIAIQFSNLTHHIIESKLDVHGDHLRIIAFIITFIMAIIGCFLKPKMAYFNEIFNLFLYFNFFVIGVVFKELFRSQHPWSLRNWHWHFIIFALLIF